MNTTKNTLKANDKIIPEVISRCENIRKRFFPDVPQGVYVLNPLMSPKVPSYFQPLDINDKKYIMRLQSKFYRRGGKKLNNAIKCLFVQTRLWQNGMSWEHKDSVVKEISQSKISGLLTKIKTKKKYKLYCPECQKRGRINYTITTNVKPRSEFCPYCNQMILFRVKTKGRIKVA